MICKGGLEALKANALTALKALLSYPSKDALLIFHDDADGIASGALAYIGLTKYGFNVKAVCIEKLMPQVIEHIHATNQGKVIFYVDIGSPHANVISKYNKGRNLTIILDHHDPTPSEDEYVLNINPEFYGLEGERDSSGSTVVYYFFRLSDESMKKHSLIALVGAEEIPEPRGELIKIVAEDAKGYKLSDVKEMFRVLQVLGSVGYYKNGPLMGLKACVEGLTEDIKAIANQWEEQRKAANSRLLSILYKKGLNKLRYIQFFDSYDVFKGMGTKVLGTFASYLSYQGRLIDRDKYIIGFMDMPNEIPGLMYLKGTWTKVSSRVTDYLRAKIDANKYPSVNDVLVKSAEEVGGLADGHKHAASAVIPRDKQSAFLEAADAYVGRKVAH